MGALGKALLVAATAALAFPSPTLARKAPIPAGSRYVALGSSIASGPGLGPPKPGTPPRCTRSDVNYPTLLAARLNLKLDDQSCSAALTGHLLEPWGELPAQIDAVTAETRLVTVGIGGNDIGYVGSLIAASCQTLGSGSFPLGPAGTRCPAIMHGDEVAYARLVANLRTIASEVHRRAPQARVIFVEYPALVPDRLCPDTPLSPQEAAISRAAGDRLAAITGKVARESGAEVLETNRIGRSHTACSARPWAAGFPKGYNGSDGAPWHFNRAGMKAVADILEKMLNR